MSRTVEVMLVGGSRDGEVITIPEGLSLLYLVHADASPEIAGFSTLRLFESAIPRLSSIKTTTEAYRRVSNDYYRFDRIVD
jgi:hypothetical protein